MVIRPPRTLLKLLAPHLAASIRTAVELLKLNERQALYDDALARLSRAFVNINKKGEIASANDLGQRLLTKYFSDRGLKNGSSEGFYDWVNSLFVHRELAGFEIVPFICERWNSRLRIDVIGWSPPDEITLLLYEKAESKPDVLQILGLTNRESEILYWVAQGKNDEIIALLCGISVRTVNKHLEHIYRKLGVESRLAAVRATRELLNR